MEMENGERERERVMVWQFQTIVSNIDFYQHYNHQRKR